MTLERVKSVAATDRDIFKAGFWHGMETLERRLIELALVAPERLELVSDVIAAEYETIPEADRSLIIAAGVFTVDALRDKNPNGQEVTH